MANRTDYSENRTNGHPDISRAHALPLQGRVSGLSGRTNGHGQTPDTRTVVPKRPQSIQTSAGLAAGEFGLDSAGHPPCGGLTPDTRPSEAGRPASGSIAIEITPRPSFSEDGRVDWWPVAVAIGGRSYRLAYSGRKRRFADTKAARLLVRSCGITAFAAVDALTKTSLGSQ